MTACPQYPLLDTLDEPAALRKLSRRALPQVAAELRAFLLASVAQTGGHLSSNLGTVELTVALHYVSDTPRDRLVWDVGHQTYAHKILTGRREAMSRLRMAGGPSGPGAPRASTTPSAPRIRRRRSPRRSAWQDCRTAQRGGS
jgi:1-deoxy-D-xylulose-5-phosphate synthase